MSLQYAELQPTSAWDRLASLGHHSKIANFNGFHFLALLLHQRRSVEVNQTLHNVWPSPGLVRCMYIFGGSCRLTSFCQVQYSLCVQVLHSPILAALLHGICSTAFNRGCHLYSEGGHHVGHRPTFYTVSQKKGYHPTTIDNFNYSCPIPVIFFWYKYCWVNMPLKGGLIYHLTCLLYVPYLQKL